jgi:hypothetical protein
VSQAAWFCFEFLWLFAQTRQAPKARDTIVAWLEVVSEESAGTGLAFVIQQL